MLIFLPSQLQENTEWSFNLKKNNLEFWSYLKVSGVYIFLWNWFDSEKKLSCIFKWIKKMWSARNSPAHKIELIWKERSVLHETSTHSSALGKIQQEKTKQIKTSKGTEHTAQKPETQRTENGKLFSSPNPQVLDSQHIQIVY